MKKNTKGGFTLIEILIVIGIIAILAAIVLVAVNPARQFSKANNTQRSSNTTELLSAVGQYIIDQKGATSTLALTVGAPMNIKKTGGYDLCSKLVATYIPSFPQDPKTNGGANITDCSSAYDTGYTINIDSNDRITIAAPNAEIGATIAVTR